MSAPASAHAAQLVAWRQLWHILLAPPAESASSSEVNAHDDASGHKETAPSLHLEAVDVDSPHSLASQERKADAMNSSRNQPPALDASRSDRTLGAQSRPGAAAVKEAAP